MMIRLNRWAAVLLLPTMLAAACGDKSDDRDALKKDDLDRQLDLALQKDTGAATFQDTAIGAAPAPQATTPPQPAPQPQATPSRPRTPQPRPQQQTPPRSNPAPAPAPAPRPSRPALTVATGTTFAVSLNDQISTETNHVGDAFTATVHDPVVAADGTVLIPAGATVRGRVTQVAKSGRVGETGVIRLAFESVSFDGKSFPLDASVVEANPQQKTRQSTAEQVGKVAAGAAAGAIIGKILGKNTKGAVKGGVIGAAAGTAIAMGTADVDVVLPQNSRVVIKVDSPIEVRPAT